MLKILAVTTVCMITLTACGAVNSLMEERFRIRHLGFTKQEYRKSPGVLMRASVIAWGAYDEDAKVAAVIDYHTAPEQRLKGESWNQRLGMELDKFFGNLGKSNVKKPVPQQLGRQEALKRVRCLNDLYNELSKKKYRRFRDSRYPLFKAEAQCSAFLSRNPIPMRCVGWRISTGEKTGKIGTKILRTYSLRGNLVNRCSS